MIVHGITKPLLPFDELFDVRSFRRNQLSRDGVDHFQPWWGIRHTASLQEIVISDIDSIGGSVNSSFMASTRAA